MDSSEKVIHEKYGINWLGKSESHRRLNYHRRYQGIFIEHIPLKPGLRILECGSGDGDILSKLSQIGDAKGIRPLRFAACDYSLHLLSFIKKNVHLHDGHSLHLNYGSITQLPFSDDVFDIVYALSVLWYVKDIERAISEMIRVAKPGGTICFDIMGIYNLTGLLGSLSNYTNRMLFRKSQLAISYCRPGKIANIIDNNNCTFDNWSFFPFLPMGLPCFGEKLNLYRILGPIEIKTTIFRIGAGKIIYQCKKKNSQYR
jgi:ubiquinone/menaquinone biosynthesis C-methylase UbiE